MPDSNQRRDCVLSSPSHSCTEIRGRRKIVNIALACFTHGSVMANAQVARFAMLRAKSSYGVISRVVSRVIPVKKGRAESFTSRNAPVTLAQRLEAFEGPRNVPVVTPLSWFLPIRSTSRYLSERVAVIYLRLVYIYL